MFDCNTDLLDFHNEHVTLPGKEQDDMRERRNANRKRMESGLNRDKKPQPKWHKSQGSYAMWTMHQDPNKKYDIDDGAYFAYDDVLNDDKTEMSPEDIKKIVRDAVDSTSFNKKPEVRDNCVRVYYEEGYHVDIPVYRIRYDSNGQEYYELASTSWKKSDPSKVTEWFQNANKDKSPNNNDQFRWVVKLLKHFSKSREDWKEQIATGFMISKLVDELYISDTRHDRALYNAMVAIHQRLCWDTNIQHPVLDELINKGPEDQRPTFFKEKLGKAIDNLAVLFYPTCTRKQALDAWHEVFLHDFFKKRAEEADKEESAKNIGTNILVNSATPRQPVNKQGSNRNA